MPECEFPNCKRNAEKNGYCIGHAGYSSVPKEKKVFKPIPKVSEKMKVVKVELRKLYPIYLKANPICNIQNEGCTRKATTVNHTKGRGKNEILDQSTWEPSCNNCNLSIEINHNEARENGHKKQRIT